ncbi:hypothetical protein AAMO2058_000372400 [Amorphochlora amoebiformis]
MTNMDASGEDAKNPAENETEAPVSPEGALPATIEGSTDAQLNPESASVGASKESTSTPAKAIESRGLGPDGKARDEPADNARDIKSNRSRADGEPEAKAEVKSQVEVQKKAESKTETMVEKIPRAQEKGGQESTTLAQDEAHKGDSYSGVVTDNKAPVEVERKAKSDEKVNSLVQEQQVNPGLEERAKKVDQITKATRNTIYAQEQGRKKMMRRAEARENAFLLAATQRGVDVSKADTYWKKQQDLLDKVVERLEIAKKTLRALKEHFLTSKVVLNSVSQILKATAKVGEGESTTLFNACSAQVNLRKRVATHVTSQNFDQVLKNSDELYTHLDAETTEIKRVGSRILDGLNSQREKCQSAWDAYAAAHKQALKGSKVSGKGDPALLLRSYERRTLELQTLCRRYQQHVPRLVARYYREDVRRISSTQTIMLQHLLEQVNLHQLCINMCNSAIKNVQAIDPRSDIQEFSQSHGLPVESYVFGGLERKGIENMLIPSAEHAAALGAGPEMDGHLGEIALGGSGSLPVMDFRAIDRLTRLVVQKSGTVCLHQRLMGMDRWLPVWILLSYHGQLHFFGRRDATAAFESVNLELWSATLEPELDSLAVRLRLENPGWSFTFSRTTYVLKFANFDDLTDWTIALKDHVKRKHVGIPKGGDFGAFAQGAVDAKRARVLDRQKATKK